MENAETSLSMHLAQLPRSLHVVMPFMMLLSAYSFDCIYFQFLDSETLPHFPDNCFYYFIYFMLYNGKCTDILNSYALRIFSSSF